MTGIHIRPDVTEAQKRALRWLHNRGGEGMFTKGQVLLARGELAAVERKTWNALSAAMPPCITYTANKGYKRVSMTEAGKALALTWTGNEADTVWDDEE